MAKDMVRSRCILKLTSLILSWALYSYVVFCFYSLVFCALLQTDYSSLISTLTMSKYKSLSLSLSLSLLTSIAFLFPYWSWILSSCHSFAVKFCYLTMSLIRHDLQILKSQDHLAPSGYLKLPNVSSITWWTITNIAVIFFSIAFCSVFFLKLSCSQRGHSWFSWLWSYSHASICIDNFALYHISVFSEIAENLNIRIYHYISRLFRTI